MNFTETGYGVLAAYVHVDSNVHRVGTKQESTALTSGYLTPGAVLTLASWFTAGEAAVVTIIK